MSRVWAFRLQAHQLAINKEAFDGCFLFDECDDNVAGFSVGLFSDDNVIAFQDAGIEHTGADDAQGETLVVIHHAHRDRE